MGEYRADLAGFRQPGPLREGDPAQLGPYRLLGRLGAGGMGVVFLGEDGSGRRVAVKLPREMYAEDPVFRARFAREVAAAERVSGRFTAQVLGYSVEGDRPWLATELVPGPSLREFVARYGPLRHGGQRALAAGLAEALAAIHEVGLVHRDLKPSNVLCAPDGPRVIDFGIAVGGEASRLTQVGMVVGSPAWMAPEHMRGERVGPTADMFAWALLVSYAGSGRAAFGEDGAPAEMLHRVLYGVPDLGPPEALAPDLQPLVRAALAKEPEPRPTARAVCAQLVGVSLSQPVAVAAERVGQLVDRAWSTTQHPGLGSAPPVPGPPVQVPQAAYAHPARPDQLHANPPPANPLHASRSPANPARTNPAPADHPYQPAPAPVPDYPAPPGLRPRPRPLTPVGGAGGPRSSVASRRRSRAARRSGRWPFTATGSGGARARHSAQVGPWPVTYFSRSYRRKRAVVGVVTLLVAVVLLVIVLSVFPASTPRG